MESHNEIIGCFYTNITDTENGIIGVDGTGYLVTPTDLKTKYVNGNLNNTLSENSSSFNCHFENMEIKEGSPTHTDFEVGIYTATQLVDFANDFNNYDYTGYSEYLVQARLYLRDDIDMKNVDYTPIGGNNNFGHPLDGNNHKISNLSDCSSFLGKTSGSPRATVENLILENPEFTGDNCGLICKRQSDWLKWTNGTC